MDSKEKGIYPKFHVQRADGEHLPGGKHHKCDYFVLDLTHDPFAQPAILAYADACEADGYDALAHDLRKQVDTVTRECWKSQATISTLTKELERDDR